jgi:hypothetical protein
MDNEEYNRVLGIILSDETRSKIVNHGRGMGLDAEADDCAQMTLITACRKVMAFEGRPEPAIMKWLTQKTNYHNALRVIARRKPHAEYGSDMGGDRRRRDPISPSFGVRAGEASSKFERAMDKLPAEAKWRLQRRIVEKASRESMIAELRSVTPLQLANACRAKAEGRRDDPDLVKVEKEKMQLTKQLGKDCEQLLELLRGEDFGPSDISLLRWKP